MCLVTVWVTELLYFKDKWICVRNVAPLFSNVAMRPFRTLYPITYNCISVIAGIFNIWVIYTCKIKIKHFEQFYWNATGGRLRHRLCGAHRSHKIRLCSSLARQSHIKMYIKLVRKCLTGNTFSCQPPWQISLHMSVPSCALCNCDGSDISLRCLKQ